MAVRIREESEDGVLTQVTDVKEREFVGYTTEMGTLVFEIKGNPFPLVWIPGYNGRVIIEWIGEERE